MSTHIYKNPEKYNKNSKLQFDFAMDVLSKMKIDKNARGLDIGCGDGRITFEIAKIIHSVVGTDISDSMIKYASETYREKDNLRFIQMDASKNFFSKQFDLITSFNCLHWVRDQESALCGISSAAVENAKIILLLSHRKSDYHFALDAIITSQKWRTYFKDYNNPRSFFEIEEYNILLKNAGLHVVTLNEREMTYEFGSVGELKSFLSSSMANINQIPDHEKEEFLNDYCGEFFKLINNKNRVLIPVSFWCLEVFATKLGS